MNDFDWTQVKDTYNQYKEYTNIPKLLKRYSLDEKMRIACIHSSKAMDFGNKIGRDNSQHLVLPWCLETFVMIALEADEYSDGRFEGNGEKRFIDMVNTIWGATGKVFEEGRGRFFFSRFILSNKSNDAISYAGVI